MAYSKLIRAAALVAIGAFITASLFTFRATTSRPSTTSAEAGFARDMSTHHKQAVAMAFIIRESSNDPAVRGLAYDIANTQSTQSGMFMGWLQQWGLPQSSPRETIGWMRSARSSGHLSMMSEQHSQIGYPMTGMANPVELEELSRLQKNEADVMFLRLMIRHHMGGIEMAKAVLELSGRREVRQLAQTIVDGQQAEIDLMQRMLKASLAY